jgi:Mrp family chromosome partitioning ATPase
MGQFQGRVDCLVGVDLSSAVRKAETGRFETEATEKATATGGELSVLTGGRRAPNPAELLSGPAFGRLLSEATRLYDRVIVDTAPVLAVSDTLLMTPLVQTVCVVVYAGKTPRNAVQRALGMLTGAGGRPAGVILNRMPRRRGSGYFIITRRTVMERALAVAATEEATRLAMEAALWQLRSSSIARRVRARTGRKHSRRIRPLTFRIL